MDLQLSRHAGNEVTRYGNRFGVLAPRQGQGIGFLKRAQEERVLRNKAAEEIHAQRAIAESLYERMCEARSRPVKIGLPQHVVEHSDLPGHLPELPLVHE